MGDYNPSIHEERRGHRGRYSSESEDDRPRKERDKRRGSLDRYRYSDTNGGSRNENYRTDSRPQYRSRSPKRDQRLAESLGSEPRSRNYREDRRSSHRNRSISRSPPPKRRRRDSRDDGRDLKEYRSHRGRSPSITRSAKSPRSPIQRLPVSKRSHAPLPSQKDAFIKDPNGDAIIKPPVEVEKQKPNYAPTGKLAAETNTVANTSIVLKYNEPPEARLPPSSAPWRLYIFKGNDMLETLQLHERSCWLFGRERAVVDFPIEHPSCSKQHVVLQFRYTERKNEWGERKGGVKPYIIDLESANGTKVNGDTVPDRKFFEVRDKDVITFGESTREYVMILPPKEEKKG